MTGPPRTPYLRLFLGLVAFSLAGSLLSAATRLDPGPIAPVASLLTLAAGVAATFAAYWRTVPHAPGRLGLTLLWGAGAEVVGLATGFPFGRYAYTGAWWPSISLPVGPFPLSLPFAWLLMAGASVLALPPRLLPAGRSVLGGLLAATIDLAMEPVLAGPLHYWRWLERGPLPGGAPVANFLGWWAVGTVAGFVLIGKEPPPEPETPRWVLGGFLLLILGLGLILSVFGSPS